MDAELPLEYPVEGQSSLFHGSLGYNGENIYLEPETPRKIAKIAVQEEIEYEVPYYGD